MSDELVPKFNASLPAVRVFSSDIDRLEAICEKHPDRYENVSHAIRCAVQQFIRREL